MEDMWIKFTSGNIIRKVTQYLWSFSNTVAADKVTIWDLRIDVHESTIEFSIDNHYLYCHYIITDYQSNVPSGSRYKVNSAIFKDIIAKLYMDNYICCSIKDNVMEITSSQTNMNTNYKIYTEYIHNISKDSTDIIDTENYSISINSLKTIIDKILSSIADVTNDQTFAKIFVTSNENSIEYLSTDRKRLCHINLSINTKCNHSYGVDIALMGKIIKALVHLRIPNITLFYKDNKFGWYGHGAYGWIKTDKYIDLKRFSILNDIKTVDIQKDIFEKAIQRVNVLKSVVQQFCTVAMFQNNINISVHEPNKGNVSVSISTTGEYPKEICTCYNINYLQLAIKFSEEVIKLHVQTINKHSLILESSSTLPEGECITKFMILPVF